MYKSPMLYLIWLTWASALFFFKSTYIVITFTTTFWALTKSTFVVHFYIC